MRSILLACSIVTTACVSQVTGSASVAIDGAAANAKSAYVTYPDATRIWPSVDGGAPGASGVRGIIVLASSDAGEGCATGTRYESRVATIEFALPYTAGASAELDQLPAGHYPVVELGAVGVSAPALATPSAGIGVGSYPPDDMTTGELTLTAIAHGRITGVVDASSPTASLSGTFDALLCDHPAE